MPGRKRGVNDSNQVLIKYSIQIASQCIAPQVHQENVKYEEINNKPSGKRTDKKVQLCIENLAK